MTASPTTALRRPVRALAALCVAAGLGACQAGRPAAEASAARYASLDTPTALAPRSGTLVASMPDWIGKPLRLRERRDGGFEQASVLALSAKGDARGNLVLVAIGGPGAGGLDTAVDPGAALAPMAQPSEAGIRTEIATAFPGTTMRVVTRPSANAYGPYGLAVGRSAGGARCLYAWQWLEDPRASIGGEGWPAGPLSLRVRLCRDDISLEAMAAAVTKLRLAPPGPPGATAPALAEAARPDRPMRAERREPRRPAPRPARDAETAETPVKMPQPASRPVPPAPLAAVPGRRYLGAETATRPVSLAAGSAALPALVPAAADLPPEATRGPGR